MPAAESTSFVALRMQQFICMRDKGDSLDNGESIDQFPCIIHSRCSGFGHPRLAKAQDNNEIQVYSSDTVEPKSAMLKPHTDFTVEGSSPIPGSRFTDEGTYPTNHAEQETVEITQGVNSRSEIGLLCPDGR
jgi:hypothetical protein